MFSSPFCMNLVMRNYTKITIFFASSGLPYGMIAGVPGVTGLPVANHVAEARLPERGNVWCRPGWCFTDKAVFVGLIDRSTSYNSHQARLDKLIWLRSSFLHCLLFKNRSTNPCTCHWVNLKRLEKCSVWRDNPTKTGYGLVPMKHGPILINGTQTWTWFEWYPMQYWRFIDLQQTIFAWSSGLVAYPGMCWKYTNNMAPTKETAKEQIFSTTRATCRYGSFHFYPR